jgi:HEPN domain-containing protein
MGSYNYEETLIRRSKALYTYALEAINRGDYDLTLNT